MAIFSCALGGERAWRFSPFRRGTGLIPDRENRAQIGCRRPNLIFSGALRSEKVRERAHDSRIFRRER